MWFYVVPTVVLVLMVLRGPDGCPSTGSTGPHGCIHGSDCSDCSTDVAGPPGSASYEGF